VLTLGGKRIYLSGDTEDIPEMRGLKNIDVAFLCMNLPYTMTVEQAASAVRDFKPKIVYPYHSRVVISRSSRSWLEPTSESKFDCVTGTNSYRQRFFVRPWT